MYNRVPAAQPPHRRETDIAFRAPPVEGWRNCPPVARPPPPNEALRAAPVQLRGDDRVPGTNLTREEAQQRAKLLTVDSYEIDLDLSGAQEGGTYRSVTTVRFDSAETGAESFI